MSSDKLKHCGGDDDACEVTCEQSFAVKLLTAPIVTVSPCAVTAQTQLRGQIRIDKHCEIEPFCIQQNPSDPCVYDIYSTIRYHANVDIHAACSPCESNTGLVHLKVRSPAKIQVKDAGGHSGHDGKKKKHKKHHN